MGYSYDQQMSEIHVLLAWCSVGLFFLRGFALALRWPWALDSRLRVLAFTVTVLLTVTGLSLWVLRHYDPTRDGWLLAKLLALAAYTGFAHRALGLDEFHLRSYLVGLLCLAYMLAVSLTRSASMGLF